MSESMRWALESSRFGQVSDVVNASRRWSRPVQVLTTAGQVLQVQMLVLPQREGLRRAGDSCPGVYLFRALGPAKQRKAGSAPAGWLDRTLPPSSAAERRVRVGSRSLD